MTFASGMRVRRSRIPTALEDGGTGSRTREEAVAALQVPSLSGDNTFTGQNQFGAVTTVLSGSLYLGSNANVLDGGAGVNASRSFATASRSGLGHAGAHGRPATCALQRSRIDVRGLQRRLRDKLHGDVDADPADGCGRVGAFLLRQELGGGCHHGGVYGWADD